MAISTLCSLNEVKENPFWLSNSFSIKGNVFGIIDMIIVDFVVVMLIVVVSISNANNPKKNGHVAKCLVRTILHVWYHISHERPVRCHPWLRWHVYCNVQNSQSTVSSTTAPWSAHGVLLQGSCHHQWLSLVVYSVLPTSNGYSYGIRLTQTINPFFFSSPTYESWYRADLYEMKSSCVTINNHLLPPPVFVFWAKGAALPKRSTIRSLFSSGKSLRFLFTFLSS